jgi:hypothetical protein
MTLEDAEKLAKVAECIDGNCDTCIQRFLDELNSAFPQFYFRIVSLGGQYKVVVHV